MSVTFGSSDRASSTLLPQHLIMAETDQLVSSVEDEFWKSFMPAGTARNAAAPAEPTQAAAMAVDQSAGRKPDETPVAASGPRTTRRARVEPRPWTGRTWLWTGWRQRAMAHKGEGPRRILAGERGGWAEEAAGISSAAFVATRGCHQHAEGRALLCAAHADQHSLHHCSEPCQG